jgi:hypothetical protein
MCSSKMYMLLQQNTHTHMLWRTMRKQWTSADFFLNCIILKKPIFYRKNLNLLKRTEIRQFCNHDPFLSGPLSDFSLSYPLFDHLLFSFNQLICYICTRRGSSMELLFSPLTYHILRLIVSLSSFFLNL